MVNWVSLVVMKGLAHIKEITATKPDSSNYRTGALFGWISHLAKGVICIKPKVKVISTYRWKSPGPDKHAVCYSMPFVGVDPYAAQSQGDNRGGND
jgi:hypothetical protein